ncbi:MAG: hypothetical protein LBO04_06795 [Spirochaetaceae bacterium]|nr:hypothetical protein [Spirochaetaceae bacterium]
MIDLNNREAVKIIDLSEALAASNAQSHFISVTKDGKYLRVGERQETADGQALVVDTASGEALEIFYAGAAIGQHLSRDGIWLFPVSGGKGDVTREYGGKNCR